MSKSLEELKNEMASVYANKHGIAIAKKVKIFTVDLHLGNPQQYDYEYSKNIIAEYAFMAGFDAAIKAVSEREKKLVDILSQINIDNPSFEDSRIEWMEIQIDKSLAEEIREFLAEIKKESDE